MRNVWPIGDKDAWSWLTGQRCCALYRRIMKIAFVKNNDAFRNAPSVDSCQTLSKHT